MTDEPTVWEYDGYNQKIDDSGVHRTLRIGRDSSDFIAYEDPLLFEPMSMREENWAESGVKNSLRAGASKSSHAVVSSAVESEQPQAIAFTTEQTPKFSSDMAFTLTSGSPSGGGQPQSVMQRVQMLNFQGSKGNTVVSEDGQSFTLNAMHGHDMHVVGYEVTIPSNDTNEITEGVWSVSFRGREGGMTAEQGEEGVANTIRAGQGGSVRPHILISDRPVGTLTTDMGTKMQINNQSVDSNHLQVFSGGQEMTGQDTNLVVRRLTPLECELLMGWDEGWTSIGIQEDGTEVKMADTHRYRMCGNGVVANVAEWFGLRYVQARNASGQDW